MGSHSQKLGQIAEDAAASFLMAQGFIILEKNYRIRTAEIDIIAKDGDTLVFVEVKARSSFSRGTARESVGLAKQQRIVMAASHFLMEKKLFDIRVRFDVVAICEENNIFKIELIKNAFQAE